MKKLYLFSDVSKESGFQKEVSGELISDVLGKDKITIISGYPYDAELSEEKVKNITNNFGKVGIKFNKVELLLNSDSEELINNKLKDTDVLFLTGGNPLEQYEFIKSKNLINFIKEYDGIIMGISAGSMNLTEKVLLLPVSEEYPETIIYDGLKLAPFSIFPHFNIKSVNDERVDMGYGQEFIMNDLKKASKYSGVVYCLPDRCSLIVENDKIRILDDKCYVIENGVLSEL